MSTTTPLALRRTVSVAVCAAGVLAAGCAATPPPTATPPASNIAPLPEQGSDEQAIERAYKDFWRVSWVSGGEPDSAWENRLREVTVGSFADHIASRVRQKRSEGTGFYGAITPRLTDVRVEGDRATVVDCQDTSHAGQSDLATGTPRTVGIERNATRATMVEEAQGMWRVSQVEFPEGEC